MKTGTVGAVASHGEEKPSGNHLASMGIFPAVDDVPTGPALK